VPTCTRNPLSIIAEISSDDGKITEIGPDLPASGGDMVDVCGLIIVPGLIDLHTHVYWGGTSLGVDAAEVARRSGRRRSSMLAALALAYSTGSAVM
jgi:predicted amidohydrolase